MWRVYKICPECLEADFDKNEEGCLVCRCCGEVYDSSYDLEDMEYDEG